MFAEKTRYENEQWTTAAILILDEKSTNLRSNKAWTMQSIRRHPYLSFNSQDIFTIAVSEDWMALFCAWTGRIPWLKARSMEEQRTATRTSCSVASSCPEPNRVWHWKQHFTQKNNPTNDHIQIMFQDIISGTWWEKPSFMNLWITDWVETLTSFKASRRPLWIAFRSRSWSLIATNSGCQLEYEYIWISSAYTWYFML